MASRARKKSDDTYNARRRFRRQAERYVKKAEQTSGAESARYKVMAEIMTKKALQSYSPGQKPRGKVAQLSERLGIDTQTILRSAGAGFTSGSVSASKFIQLSQSALRSVGADRDQMALDILSTGNIGGRFYGGLVGTWYDQADRKKNQHPNQAILDYFGAKSLMDVLDLFVEADIDIFAPEENQANYDSAKLKLQEYVAMNRDAYAKRQKNSRKVQGEGRQSTKSRMTKQTNKAATKKQGGSVAHAKAKRAK